MPHYQVIIIGAGAAGLMCAIEAGKRNRSTLVLDHANKPGKKILMSGGGRCNFTNLDVRSDHFISHNRQFCKSALSRFTPWHFISLVEKHGIPYHEKTLGQLFCDNKSKDIVEMLLAECDNAQVNIQLNTSIDTIKPQTANGFSLQTSKGHYTCDSLVIATGGLSIPTMGASPFGYRIAKQFNIRVWPTRAGLVPFTLHTEDKSRLAPLSGIAQPCSVQCNKTQFQESMLFTHRGLSGPAMLQISSYWTPGDSITVDLLPQQDLAAQLQQQQKQHPNSLLKNALHQQLPKRVVSTWLNDTEAQKTLQHFSHKRLEAIAQSFKRWCIQPNGTEGYRTAEVTLGGVDCDAISSKTFEVKQVPGLYFIGEVLDISGWLGGYNFQWAWASGFAAGQVV